jgi:transmembrane sensor
MRSGQTAREIDEEAAQWAMRQDRDLDSDFDDSLKAWLAGDPRRQGALLRAQAALSLVDRARALPEPVAPSAGRIDRRVLIGAGAAIAAAIPAAVGFALLSRKPERFSTARGELRRVPLSDGSVAEINTETALDVTMARQVRRIRLEQGEAWFAVAKDPARPFVVEASNIRVAAVGTAFSVNDAAQRLQVLVTEGVVEAWRAGGDGRRVRIEAGSRLSVAADGRFLVTEAAEDIARDLAWRTGQIDLAGRTLADAVLEFNRYNRRPIVIDDPALADQALVGLFATNEAASFARAAGAAFSAPVLETDAAIHLGSSALGK